MTGNNGPGREGQGYCQSIFVQPEPGMVVRLREMYPVSAQSSSVVIMVEGVEGGRAEGVPP